MGLGLAVLSDASYVHCLVFSLETRSYHVAAGPVLIRSLPVTLSVVPRCTVGVVQAADTDDLHKLRLFVLVEVIGHLVWLEAG